jgi:hypothetical protein
MLNGSAICVRRMIATKLGVGSRCGMPEPPERNRHVTCDKGIYQQSILADPQVLTFARTSVYLSAVPQTDLASGFPSGPNQVGLDQSAQGCFSS